MQDGTSRSLRHTSGTVSSRSPAARAVSSRSPAARAVSSRSPAAPADGVCEPRIELTSACQVRDLLDRLADKWSLLVVELLGQRTHRFMELRREIDGISQRMLTLTLRQLERDGLVRRTVYAVVPPRVDYELTVLGTTLLPAIRPLVDWARAHQDEIAVARVTYDERPVP
jgi:DNA-binding HxlR family transcriptional regulator